MKLELLYKEKISQQNSESLDTETELPQNFKQLQNLCVKYLDEKRIFKDEFYNLHEIDFDIQNKFVQKVITIPDLVCVCGLKEVLSEADKAIMLNETG